MKGSKQQCRILPLKQSPYLQMAKLLDYDPKTGERIVAFSKVREALGQLGQDEPASG